jgi:hypothetical protein
MPVHLNNTFCNQTHNKILYNQYGMITFCGYFAFSAQTHMLCTFEHGFTLGFPVIKCYISSIVCSHFVVIMHLYTKCVNWTYISCQLIYQRDSF